MMQPTAIRLDRPLRLLLIDWSDGSRCEYSWDFLRDRCPSASEMTAREQRTADPLAVLKKAPSKELVNVHLVGNYALNLHWADGHRDGIYSWEYLRQLAASADPRPQ